MNTLQKLQTVLRNIGQLIYNTSHKHPKTNSVESHTALTANADTTIIYSNTEQASSFAGSAASLSAVNTALGFNAHAAIMNS